jgi:hypothetical protein
MGRVLAPSGGTLRHSVITRRELCRLTVNELEIGG